MTVYYSNCGTHYNVFTGVFKEKRYSHFSNKTYAYEHYCA